MRKMMKKSKAGFTLVELMVVAIIVAILAAVAIPLMTGNKNRAMATEAQAGLGTVRTALQVYKAEFNGYPAVGAVAVTAAGLSVKAGDLDGKYYKTTGYSFTTCNASNYTISAVGYTNGAENITITLNQNGDWTGVP